DTYGPGLGFRMPPSSPQKMADGRLVDVQPGQSPHSPYSGPPSRSSPVRQSFRKDSCSSVFMESPVNKPRNPSSSGPPELFPGPGDRPLSGFGSPGPAKDTETSLNPTPPSLQLQNQETVKTMLRRTETEISVRVTDTMRKHEDPLQRQRSLVEEERLRYLNEEELITQQLNDLEKSVEKIQKDLAHNHRLIPVQELEEKAVVLKQLGETLTDLKAQFPSLQSKMRVVLRVEVEAVKFLKEEPNRLDGLLKRCKTVTDTLAQIRRQVDEGVWTSPSILSQSPKKVAPETDFSKGLDLEMPTSPPVSLHHLTAGTETLGMPSFGHSPPQTQTHPSKSNNPSRAPEKGPAKTQTGPETPSKKSADKAVSVEHRLCPDELTVPRYRTEKPSKSPPPPPPRRSFPSSHGLTTTRSGEVIVTSKKEPGFMKKAESEELETQKPQVKLRRTVSEVVRPASTPPIIASAIKDDDDEDRIIAELEVFQRSSASPFLPKLRSKEICEGTYQRLDSLEETIRELELTIHEISSHPLAEFVFPKELLGQAGPEDACEKTEEAVAKSWLASELAEALPGEGSFGPWSRWHPCP
ncbi:SRC kinase signaling inhibitor 1, partial [Egretta garzetta]|uniref:SRC kinase signaling inhibitor 1 n=1 Tax=Egretta garzetta TaxID=188379 RepID=UPI00051F11AD